MVYGSLSNRTPPAKATRVSPRSVSDPFGAPSSASNNATSESYPLPSNIRRSSFDFSVTDEEKSPTSKKHYHHGLPSIKALREKFQALASGGRKSTGNPPSSKAEASPGKPVSPRKLSRRTNAAGGGGPPVISGPGAGGRALKGFAGPAGAKDERSSGTIVKSASMPSIAGSRPTTMEIRDTRPPLPLQDSNLSVDAFLANSTSTPSAALISPISATSRPPRTSSISLGPRRPQTIENLSPMSQPLPVFNRISSDFARPSAAPPLSSLRAPQLRETETLVSNRYSRILPGATLPSSFPEVDPERPSSRLSRSFSAGAALNSEKRRKRTSTQSAVSRQTESIASVRGLTTTTSALLPNGLPKDNSSALKDDLAYRRHSLSPVVTVGTVAGTMSREPSPERSRRGESEPTRPEDQRGKTLSNLLGVARRPSIGLGFSTSPSPSRAGGSLEKRRPSKPFPGGFEEVPFQATNPVPTTTPVDPSSVSALASTPLEPAHSKSATLSPALSGISARKLKAISIAPRQTPSPALLSASTLGSPQSNPSQSLASPPQNPSQPLPSILPDFNPFGPDRDQSIRPVFPVNPLKTKAGGGRPIVRQRQSSAELVSLAIKKSSEGLESTSETRDGETEGLVEDDKTLRKSRSETELWTPSSVSALSDIEKERSSYFGQSVEGEEQLAGTGKDTVGAYAARLLELRALRTPVLGNEAELESEDVRMSRNEEVMSEASRPAMPQKRGSSSRRTIDDEDAEDESRPVSPTHFKNSPGAEHPFRLSTYLDLLPLSASSSIKTTEPLQTSNLLSPPIPSRPQLDNLSPSFSSYSLAPPATADLTLDEMQREIAKMEVELALAGTPQSFFTEEPNPNDFSPSTLRSLGVPSSDTSKINSPDENGEGGSNSFITPRTARKWSIVEVEKAYERMKRMLGSSSSSRFYSPSDADGDSQIDIGGVDPLDVRQLSGQAKEEEQEVLRDTSGDVFSVPSPGRQSTPLSSGPSLFDQQGSPSLPSSLNKFKPLPGIPPPSPSRRTDSPASVQPDRSQTPPAKARMVDSAVGDSPRPPREPVTSSTIAEETIAESSSTPPGEPDGEITTSPRQRAISDLGNHRRLVLPSRVRSKTSIDELRPLSPIETTSEDGTMKAFSTPPTSPLRGDFRSHGPVSPGGSASGRRSRLSNTGLLRSGAGREMQRLANGTEGDSTADESGTSPARVSSRVSIHRLVPPAEIPRRRELTRSSDSTSWYPSTPGRRSRGTTGDSSLIERERGDSRLGVLSSDDGSETTTASTARPELAEIRKLDKLEIFFKYTAVKADLEKAEVEREALFDALRETRETLAEVRKQRDQYEEELKHERRFAEQVKKHLGDEADIYVDKLESMIASRTAWQQRAQEALEELQETREELEQARRQLVAGKEREEHLERESVMLGARLAASAAGSHSPSPSTIVPTSRLASRVTSPRLSTSPRSSGFPTFSSHHGSNSPRSSTGSIRQTTSSAPGSPTLIVDRTNTLPSPSTPKSSNIPRPKDPSSLAATERHRRVISTHSIASSTGGLDGIAEIGSPLMSQTMTFGPKSSNGSHDSPLKKHQPSPPTTLGSKFTTRPATTSHIPFPSSSSSTNNNFNPDRRGSKLSTRSNGSTFASSSAADLDDMADRSFDSVSSAQQTDLDGDDEEGGGFARAGTLKERDAAFLDDLTSEIPKDVLEEQSVNLSHLIEP